MKNQELLVIDKAISTSTLGTGGLLGAEDAKAFITSLIDQSQILSMVRSETMRNDTKNIDVLSVAGRQLRKHNEGIDPGYRAKITTTRNVLTAIKCMLPIEITEDTLEENIEKEGFEKTLMDQFALAYGNDLADLSINGDTADTSPDADFLTINDGWIKLMKAVSNNVDNNSSTDYIANFQQALLAMPNRFKVNKANLRFLVSANDELGFRAQLTTRETSMGDAYLDKDMRARYMGILVEPLEYMPNSVHILTNPKNLVFGIEYGIKVASDKDIFADVRQHAITTKNDFNMEINEAAVISWDMP